MPKTKEQQDFITAMQNYAEQLVVDAYARTTDNPDEHLSEEVLAELVDAVERRLIVEATKAVESVANSMASTDKESVQPTGRSEHY
jgi:arginine deiminase